MRQSVHLEASYLLASRPYSDSSLLVEVFSREHGRIALVARGARGARSKLRGVLQPFRPLLLSWRLNGEVGTLTGAEAAAPPTLLSGEEVLLAWYCNELLTRLLQRQDAHPGLYDAYASALPRLRGGPAAVQAVLRRFEMRLLAEIGYGLLLPPQLQASLRYHYDWDLGPLEAARGYSGRSLIALRDDRLDDDAEVLQDVRHLLREALARQLGGRELQTPKLLRQMRALQ
ncbi:MAG: DNA repair protein RecO [Nevskiales bacterium]|nr:DNA repair protein RecO [Nevskiales bacterium]